MSEAEEGRAGPGQRDRIGEQSAAPSGERSNPPDARGAEPGEYRIDELARLAGTTVRNVRAYQDRGLLPAPRREGRVGLYSGAHLARLRTIADLLDRGYTLANIAELLAAWEHGQDLGALFGLEAALAAPWSDERLPVMAEAELTELFGDVGSVEEALTEAEAMGLLERVGDHFRILNPAALQVGGLLVAAGVPLTDILQSGRLLHDEVDAVAERFVDLVDRRVFSSMSEPPAPNDLSRLAELVERLRPLAKQTVDIELSRAMERHIRDRFGEHLRRVAEVADAGRDRAS